jgi:regulator of protease activity HflC (stomatin/prohibitin superfamily)
MIREQVRSAASGVPVLIVGLAGIAASVWLFVASVQRPPTPAGIILAVAGVLVSLFVLMGLKIVNPNEARVLQLFGSYRGTIKAPGLRWVPPLMTTRNVSQRIRNFESSHLKVNDLEGNPIEIASVVVWRVVDEAALRNLATSYPYDTHDDQHTSLRGHTAAVAEHLKREIQDRLAKAGVEVLEARISHLAYAPEIAAAMLQRQQAGAIIAARQRIVEGAVGMVEMALTMLSHKGIVSLDEERKAAMVSNLLVVLCGERGAQPIVNTGTIYQ